MASIARTALRTALRPTASSSAAASTSAIAPISKLPPTLSRYNSTTSTPEPSSSTSSTPSSSSTTTSFHPVTSSPAPVQYTYFVPRVGRTNSSLPVYTRTPGGQRVMTELRKISGSITDLKNDLEAFLADTYGNAAEIPRGAERPLQPKPGRKMAGKQGNPNWRDPVQLTKVPGSGKVRIYGNRVSEVKAFLESRGF